MRIIPCKFSSQFNFICPEPFVALPLNITTPEPSGSISIFVLVPLLILLHVTFVDVTFVDENLPENNVVVLG